MLPRQPSSQTNLVSSIFLGSFLPTTSRPWPWSRQQRSWTGPTSAPWRPRGSTGKRESPPSLVWQKSTEFVSLSHSRLAGELTFSASFQVESQLMQFCIIWLISLIHLKLFSLSGSSFIMIYLEKNIKLIYQNLNLPKTKFYTTKGI